MNTRPLPTVLLTLLAVPAPVGADIVWTGATSSDIFDETNWDLSNSSVTVVDPNVAIDDDVRIVDASAPVEIPDLGGQIRFEVGDAFTLTVDNSTLSSVGNDGVGGVPGTSIGPLVRVVNGGQMGTFFITNRTHLDLDATGSATFGGGATPINNSSVNLTYGATLAFTDETVADFTAEHLSKVSVDGLPAVIGANVQAVSDGGVGSVITVIPKLWSSYCISVPNSTGSAAVINATGSTSVAANNLTLTAEPIPDQVGILFYGPDQAQLTFGNGFRCVAGQLVRLPVTAGSGNVLTQAIDLSAPPSAYGAIDPGETWNFQAWFSDPAGGGALFDLSNALEVTFVP